MSFSHCSVLLLHLTALRPQWLNRYHKTQYGRTLFHATKNHEPAGEIYSVIPCCVFCGLLLFITCIYYEKDVEDKNLSRGQERKTMERQKTSIDYLWQNRMAYLRKRDLDFFHIHQVNNNANNKFVLLFPGSTTTLLYSMVFSYLGFIYSRKLILLAFRIGRLWKRLSYHKMFPLFLIPSIRF